MISERQSRAWTESKQAIAGCRSCIDRWTSRVECPLPAHEIPNPSRDIKILFVGVAPPPLGAEDGDSGHFYTNPGDRLRRGVFHVLDRVFGCDLSQQNRRSLEAGTASFLSAGFFFVHAAKVHPRNGRLAPDRKIVRFCAKRHLAHEIVVLRPEAVCFLGATNAAPAAETVFGRTIGEVPERAQVEADGELEQWTGWVVVTVQPVRGTREGRNRERAAVVVVRLKNEVEAEKRDT